ncbi:DUF4186 family protein [Pantoea eucalypti]|uniref:DUF4186 domain-containing protein n=1 Tax=Pantoea eucalypti TaxID=470933 RepID=A0ABY2ZPF1_9GAMM|nr:DUF4186 domain-containing protein [Pantoea eucalypti]QGF27904.1 DUF4186 family protein [Pantoea eucalypti]TPD96842.1 DUF4186 domain-containing protein [Pantoea vagans]TPV36588.1 DUF4186 domain-containing protein [Pantoea eucalypti]
MKVSDDLFIRLARSPFRQRFRLGRAEYDYANSKGESVVRQHAAEFVEQRLAPAQPENDGKQTPMRGHPVFIAQHATATCCRGCLSKWHNIGQHQPLSAEQQVYVVTVLLAWITRQLEQSAPPVRVTRNQPEKDDDPQLALW